MAGARVVAAALRRIRAAPGQFGRQDILAAPGQFGRQDVSPRRVSLAARMSRRAGSVWPPGYSRRAALH